MVFLFSTLKSQVCFSHTVYMVERHPESSTATDVRSEYHFSLVPQYTELRRKYLLSYYWSWPNTLKFESLLSSASKIIKLEAVFLLLTNYSVKSQSSGNV